MARVYVMAWLLMPQRGYDSVNASSSPYDIDKLSLKKLRTPLPLSLSPFTAAHMCITRCALRARNNSEERAYKGGNDEAISGGDGARKMMMT